MHEISQAQQKGCGHVVVHVVCPCSMSTCTAPQQCKRHAVLHSNAHLVVTCCGDELVSRCSRCRDAVGQSSQPTSPNRGTFFFLACLLLGPPCSSVPAEVGRLRGLSLLFSCRLGCLYLYCFSVFLRACIFILRYSVYLIFLILTQKAALSFTNKPCHSRRRHLTCNEKEALKGM